jgi:hypothetical protein
VRRFVLLAFGPLLVALVSCSSTKTPAVTQTTHTITNVNLPSEILGLHISQENVQGTIKGITGTYLQSLGLFSFREKSNLLRATLQVGIFNKLAPATKAHFRSSIIGQVGSSVPVQLRMGTTKVYLSTGTEQNIFTWFDDKAFYVLSMRGDFPFQRTLLRDLIGIQIVT